MIEGRYVELHTVEDEHLEFLYRLSSDTTVRPQWRSRGEVLSREMFFRNLWLDVLAQFVIVDRSSAEMIGHVLCYSADLRNRHAAVAVAYMPEYRALAWPVEGLVLFMSYLFQVWDLRKLYGEIVEFNFEHAFGGAGGRWFHTEGRLREHVYFNSRYWDAVQIAVYREEFQSRYSALHSRRPPE